MAQRNPSDQFEWFASSQTISDEEIVLLREEATMRADRNEPGAEGDSYDFFGDDVVISGSTLMITAPEDDIHMQDQGSVYVYERTDTDYALRSKLVAPEAVYEGKFGRSIALSGDLAAIGSLRAGSNDSPRTGVHIFRRVQGRWILQDVLLTFSDDAFGNTLATDGQRVFVRAREGVLVYEDQGGTWSESSRLIAPESANYSGFGGDIAVRGDTVFVGATANTAEVGEEFTGVVYVYDLIDHDWVLRTTLTPAQPALGDRFGRTISVSGSVLAVGAPDDGNRFDPRNGFVTIFVEQDGQWVRESTLTASDGAESDRYGQSVAIDADLLVVGASGKDAHGVSSLGAAYLYQRRDGSWVFLGQTAPPVGNPQVGGGRFGDSMALRDGDVVIGARLTSAGGFQSGAAHVYQVNSDGWSSGTQLDTGWGNARANLGAAVALHEDRAMAYASGSDHAAIVYERNGDQWQETVRLAPSERPIANRSSFGVTLALNSDTAMIGYPSEQTFDEFQRGAVYVWELLEGAWIEAQPLLAEDGAANDRLGAALAIDGEIAVVGAPGADVNGVDGAGAVYLYKKSNGLWQQTHKLIADDPGQNHQFGSAVAIDGETIAVSAAQYGPGSGLGAVFIFVRDGSDWIAQAFLREDEEDHRYGSSVALEGDTLLVGSRRRDLLDAAAYFYQRTDQTWNQSARVSDPIGGGNGTFGSAVALSGDAALVGAFGSTGNAGIRRGAAYLYRRVDDQWRYQNFISSPRSDHETEAGKSLALDGDTALIGDPRASGDSPFANLDEGRMYIYRGLTDSIGTPNASGTYWKPDEPGWGINISHQGDLMFATWYSYADDGKVMFLTTEARQNASGSFDGPVYRVIGIPFSTINGSQAFVDTTVVGDAVFAPAVSGEIAVRATVNGEQLFGDGFTSWDRLRPFEFGSSAPSCIGLVGSRSLSRNYSDLWWNPTEAGWGLTLSHRNDSIFALWYTYNEAGRDQWMSASALVLQPDGSFRGAIERPKSGTPLTQRAGPATTFPVPQVGLATLRFADGETGEFSYEVDGVMRTTPIKRFVAVDESQPFVRCLSR